MQDKLIYAFDRLLDYILRHKKMSIGICVILFALVVWMTIGNFYTYTDMTVKYDTNVEDSDGTAYESFHNNIVKYNTDGVLLSTKRGEVIWNESYDMSSPVVDVTRDYVAVYDRGGTKIYVMDDTSLVSEVDTSYPILTAAVADNGSVCALMSERAINYLEIRDLKGELIASGEFHAENNGIPIDIAFSREGDRLCVSSVSIKDGQLLSIISFYDFTSAGQKRDDNLVATYSFSNMIMPQLRYMSNGNLIAFGDGEIAVFNDSFEPALKKEIFPKGSIDSILYNNDNFGYIGAETEDDGETTKKMYIFGKGGYKKLDKVIDDTYSSAYMLSNDDIVLLTDKTASIHAISGIKKFFYTFDNSISKILYGGSNTDYVFVINGVVKDIRLR